MPGYKVLISQPQKDEVIDCSGNSPTKLIRLLMNVYFTLDVLAVSSCFGSRKFQCLDKDIILACLSELHLSLDLFIHFHKISFFSFFCCRVCHIEASQCDKINTGGCNQRQVCKLPKKANNKIKACLKTCFNLFI